MIRVKELTKKSKFYHLVLEKDDIVLCFDVSEDLIVEFRIYLNKEISESEYLLLETAINRDKHYQKVLNYALYKPRTVHEIKRYLDKNRFQDIDFYLKKLKDLKIIDDILYLKNYIYEALHFKRLGPRRIEKDLKNKGISFDLIEEQIKQIDDKVIVENLIYWYNKKTKERNRMPLMAFKKSLIAFLINKGFELSMIIEFIEKSIDDLKDPENEIILIEKEFNKIKASYQKTKKQISFRSYAFGKLRNKGFDFDSINYVIERSSLDE
jgi:regulatory protein